MNETSSVVSGASSLTSRSVTTGALLSTVTVAELTVSPSSTPSEGVTETNHVSPLLVALAGKVAEVWAV